MKAIEQKFRIGNLELENRLLFAPVAGYSDAGMRALARRYGAALAYTEMVSAKGLILGGNGSADLLNTTDEEIPAAVQLFGSEPYYVGKAVADPLLARFALIDLNMGCPVAKIFGNGEGSALMNSPEKVYEIVAAAVENASGRPVTVKTRLGIHIGEKTAVEVAREAERAGAAAVTVHGRYREQMYAGKADWRAIAEVKSAVKIPVIANGDIVDSASLAECAEVTDCDAFMLARGALGKPFIFAELLDKPYELNVKAIVLEHIGILKRYFSERTIANNMKKQLCFYAKNCDAAKSVRRALADVFCLQDLYELIDRFF